MDQLDSNQEAELDQTSTETEESGKIASEPSSGPKEWHQPAFNGGTGKSVGDDPVVSVIEQLEGMDSTLALRSSLDLEDTAVSTSAQALEKELIAERDAKVAAEAKVLDLSRQLKKLNYQQEQQQFRKSAPDQPATPPAKSSSGAPRSRSVSPKASPDGSPKRLTPTLTGYAETIEKLLSELWRERLARQRAEISASDAVQKLQEAGWSAAREGEGSIAASVDAELMKRLEEERARSTSLLTMLNSTQAYQGTLQGRVSVLEAQTGSQERLLAKMQRAAKRHVEDNLKKTNMTQTLSKATLKEGHLKKRIQALEAELSATRKVQKDTAAHFKAVTSKLRVEHDMMLMQNESVRESLHSETEKRRALASVLEEGRCLQKEIFKALQELLNYLNEQGQLSELEAEKAKEYGGVHTSVGALLSVLQEACARTATMSGAAHSATTIHMKSCQKGAGLISKTRTHPIEQGVGPVELVSPAPTSRGEIKAVGSGLSQGRLWSLDATPTASFV